MELNSFRTTVRNIFGGIAVAISILLSIIGLGLDEILRYIPTRMKKRLATVIVVFLVLSPGLWVYIIFLMSLIVTLAFIWLITTVYSLKTYSSPDYSDNL